jgi:hypothetical protein
MVLLTKYTEARRRIKQNNRTGMTGRPDQNLGSGKKIYKIFRIRENRLTNPLRVYLNWLRRGSTKFFAGLGFTPSLAALEARGAK